MSGDTKLIRVSVNIFMALQASIKIHKYLQQWKHGWFVQTSKIYELKPKALVVSTKWKDREKKDKFWLKFSLWRSVVSSWKYEHQRDEKIAQAHDESARVISLCAFLLKWYFWILWPNRWKDTIELIRCCLKIKLILSLFRGAGALRGGVRPVHPSPVGDVPRVCGPPPRHAQLLH